MKRKYLLYFTLGAIISVGCDKKDSGNNKENTDDLCHDSIDNDDDGFIDCSDQDCRSFCEDAGSDVIQDTGSENADSPG